MSVNDSIKKVDSPGEDTHSLSENEHPNSDEGCRTPVYKRPFSSTLEIDNSIQVLDLSKSPKKRKQNVGPTPYSRTLLF